MGRLVAARRRTRGRRSSTALRRAWDAGDAVLPLDPRLPGAGGPRRSATRSARATRSRTATPSSSPRAARPASRRAPCSPTTPSPPPPASPAPRWPSTRPPTAGCRSCRSPTSAGSGSSPGRSLTGDAAHLRRRPTPRHPHRPPCRPSSSGTTTAGSAPCWSAARPTGGRTGRPTSSAPTGSPRPSAAWSTTGGPLAGVEVAIAADGEVLLRSPTLLRCYRDGTDPEGRRRLAAHRRRGCARRRRRCSRVHGRRGDVIVTGGEKVWPDPVERAAPRASPAWRTSPWSAAPTRSGARPSPPWSSRADPARRRRSTPLRAAVPRALPRLVRAEGARAARRPARAPRSARSAAGGSDRTVGASTTAQHVHGVRRSRPSSTVTAAGPVPRVARR